MSTGSLPPRPWRPGALLWLSLAIHLAAVLWLLADPAQWYWPLAVLVANHLILTLVGLWPRSHALGPNWTRLPDAARARGEIAITIDDGPDPAVTPAVLDLLDAHQAQATFFCIGASAEQHPDLVHQIVQRGHHIENHSQHHRHSFSLMGYGGLLDEIRLAQATLARLTGRTPRFFRAPAGLRSPFLEPALARTGLQLAAWTRRGFDTRIPDAETVLRRLAPAVTPGSILLLHDGHAARTPGGEPVILPVLDALLTRCRERALRPVTLEAASR